LKEERDEKLAQSRILELLKEEEATQDFLAFVEDRKKQGLSLLSYIYSGEQKFVHPPSSKIVFALTFQI
jgi:hypothetical protein